MGLDRLLTRSRVTVYAWALVCVAAVALVADGRRRWTDPSIAGPVLPDLLAYWTGGRLVVDAPGALYDPTAQGALQSVVAPGSPTLSWFVGPPAAALAFAPLARVPYAVAVLAWLPIGLGLLVAGVRVARGLAARILGRAGTLDAWPWRRVLLVVVASYPVFELVGSGQVSAIVALAWFAGAVLLLDGRDLAAGLTFAVVLLKPHHAVLVPVALVLLRRWRALGSFLGGALALAGAGVLAAGWSGSVDWLRVLGSPEYAAAVQSGQAWKMASLPALVQALTTSGAPGPADAVAWAVAGALVLAWVVLLRPWRAWLDPAHVLLTALATTVCASPHLLAYDLLLLLPVAVVSARAGPGGRALVLAVFVLGWLAPVWLSLAGAFGVPQLAAPWVALPVAGLWWQTLVGPRGGPPPPTG